MKIVCHCLVKNEENFIWFAINSVIEYVDEILVWDTGSTDRTVEIVKSITNPKISFKELGELDSQGISAARQQMIDETSADWLFILDGDEIWHKQQIEQQINELQTQGSKYDLVVTPNKMLVGDVYHFLPESLGEYKIHNRKGHLNIRFIKNTPRLRIEGKYPFEAFVNKDGVKVQDLPIERILFSANYYLHTSFLPRSSKDKKKFKYELGESFALDYFYPEVFFNPDAPYVVNLWKQMEIGYKLKSIALIPIRKLRGMFK